MVKTRLRQTRTQTAAGRHARFEPALRVMEHFSAKPIGYGENLAPHENSGARRDGSVADSITQRAARPQLWRYNEPFVRPGD